MKRMVSLTVVVSVLFLAMVSIAIAEVPSMIHYQGHLTDAEGAPLDTTIAMTFTIYDDPIEGEVWWTEAQDSVIVANGLFNVLLGSVNPIEDTVFSGIQRWLGITVGDDPEISPRTRLASVPYAFRVASAGGGSCNWSVTDSVLYTNSFWGIARGGAGNVFSGCSTWTSINLGVSCTTGRDYSTVSGGFGNLAGGYASTVGGGKSNTVGDDGDYSTVSGGYGNLAGGWASTVGGGNSNTAGHDWDWAATVGGGSENSADTNCATVAGGCRNTAGGVASTVGGGDYNRVGSFGYGYYGTVGGGYKNLVEGNYSAILGGYADTITWTADHSYLFGIGSKLEEDSTFMVDMPHIFFQGEIWQANSAGDTICEFSSFGTGGGFIGTYGPNGNLNTGLSLVQGYPNNGGLGVTDANGEWRAEMLVSTAYDVGMVQTRGPNGNRNARFTYLIDHPDNGFVAVSDSLGIDRGNFYVNDSTAGMITLLGPNNSYNVVMRSVEDDPNRGSMGVCDHDGWMRAEMFVDEFGQGIVFGDEKNFRIPNPNQPGTDIWYCCLEGPEAAAYVRGTGHLVSGRAQIALPDHFVTVASQQGMTVQVTPLSAESKGLAVVEKSPEMFAVRELGNGDGTYDFDFMVTAVRKGHEDYQVIRPALETQPAQAAVAGDKPEIQLRKKF